MEGPDLPPTLLYLMRREEEVEGPRVPELHGEAVRDPELPQAPVQGGPARPVHQMSSRADREGLLVDIVESISPDLGNSREISLSGPRRRLTSPAARYSQVGGGSEPRAGLSSGHRSGDCCTI